MNVDYKLNFNEHLESIIKTVSCKVNKVNNVGFCLLSEF